MVTGKSHKPSPFARFVLYPFAAVVFFVILSGVLILANGYRLTIKNGKINLTQTGMLIVTTRPSDASININGKLYKKRTGFYLLATKISSLKPGNYFVEIKKGGYRTWRNVLEITPNMVTWANYVLLFPEKLTIDNIDTPMGKILTKSENGRYIVFENNLDKFGLEMLDTSSLSFKNIWPSLVPTQPWLMNPRIQTAELSPDSNLILLKVVNVDRIEYVIVDARANQVSLIHLNATLQQDFQNAWWNIATNDEIYLQTKSGISKVNISTTTLSAPILSEAVSFHVDDSKQILYVAKDDEGNHGVFKMNLDGGNKTLLVDTIATAESYTLGYSGHEILTVLNKDSKELTAYYFGNSGKKTATLLSTDVISFDWYKNGEYLYYYGSDFIKRYDFIKHKETIAPLTTPPTQASWFFDESHYLITNKTSVYVMDYDGSNVVQIDESPTVSALDIANNNIIYSKANELGINVFYKYVSSF